MNKIFTNNVRYSQNAVVQTNKNCSVREYGSVKSEKPFSNQILDSEFASLFPNLKKVFLENEDFIYQSGDKIKDVYFPETAVISEFQMLEDGRTSEVAMIGREGITGLEVVLNSGAASHWMRVSVAGSALKINSEIFKKEFDGNADFREVVLNYLHYYLEQTSQKIICNCYHLIEKRLCSWLLMLNDRSGKNKIPVTHEQLAHFLGVQRPSITRITQGLRERGIINYERREIVISDREKLVDAACSCYMLVGNMQ